MFSVKKYRFFTQYGQWLDDLHTDKSEFVPITNRPFARRENDIKIFAYYLPQFHAIPENDTAYGRGFTEWTNVASCSPQFVGHYQPKIPYDVGFYDLNNINIMRRQTDLAKMYGIYGFCFYYYWFNGKQVLETPLYNFLKSDLDFHFHFCWANENWSKLWDGGNKDIILKQETSNIDADKFFYDMLPFFQDARYEKIDNKPLLMIYRPTQFEKAEFIRFIRRINTLATQNGFGGIFITASNFDNFNQPTEFGLDGICEFPPHGLWDKCRVIQKQFISNRATLQIMDMHDYIRDKRFLYSAPYTVFKACFPCWDNAPRKTYSNGTCFEINDADFQIWLESIIKWTKINNPKNQQYVYINAWNEWAEGAILEPTTRWGYKKLDIVKQCLESDY